MTVSLSGRGNAVLQFVLQSLCTRVWRWNLSASGVAEFKGKQVSTCKAAPTALGVKIIEDLVLHRCTLIFAWRCAFKTGLFVFSLLLFPCRRVGGGAVRLVCYSLSSVSFVWSGKGVYFMVRLENVQVVSCTFSVCCSV